jgi:site-specific recombinase XerD
LREIGWHKLRHTFGSHLAMRGRSLLEIKELMGHRDISSTLRYAHLMPERKHEAVAALDELSVPSLRYRGDTPPEATV